MLEVRDITVRYGKTAVLDSFSVSVDEGEWLMMAGPNGAGKSTSLGAISCSIPCSGEILLDGRDLKQMRSTERAKAVGVLSQNHYVGYSWAGILTAPAYSLKRISVTMRRWNTPCA